MTAKKKSASKPRAGRSGSTGNTTGNVFLIHGRNLQAKQEFSSFLRSLRLNPVDFDKVRQSCGPAATVLEVVLQGMEESQLVVALFTPDEWSVLQGDLRQAKEGEHEHHRWQARQNVIFESGLAYGRDPKRVIFCSLGDVRLFSDMTGMHCFAPTNRAEQGTPRHTLYRWLANWFKQQGFEVDDGDGWKTAGDFESVVAPRARPVDTFAAQSAGLPWLERVAIDDVLATSRRSRELVGDSIELTPWDHARFAVRVAAPEDREDFKGNLSAHRELLERWLKGYPEEVRQFVTEHIEASSNGALEQAKLGFVSYDAGAAALRADCCIELRPTNHLITLAFNRSLAMARLQPRSFGNSVHRLWAAQLAHIFEKIQSFRTQCPSQLFLELALVTSDGYVPITEKHDLNSVYARRNGKRCVWTCGLEAGPRWQDATTMRTDDPGVVDVDLIAVALNALKSEYDLDLSAAAVPTRNLQIKSLALQALHLNTAFLGYWVLPFTREQLNTHCNGRRLGGLDHARLYFMRFEDSHQRLIHEDSPAFHGTVMARLKLLAAAEQEIGALISR